MPRVRISGYLDVPDEDWDAAKGHPTPDGYAEIDRVEVGDLDDSIISPLPPQPGEES